MQRCFDDWWNTQGEWVESPNERRKGESGVLLIQPEESEQPLLYCKRQTGHLFRTLLHPFGRPTILRELNVYHAWEKLGIKLPKVVFGEARRHQNQWQALLITEPLTGFTDMESWYASGAYKDCSIQCRQLLMWKLALVSAKLHRAHWQHGCFYPKHIFVKADEASVEIALLDLEKSRKRWSRKTAARRDLDQLYRHRGAIPENDWSFFQETFEALHALF